MSDFLLIFICFRLVIRNKIDIISRVSRTSKESGSRFLSLILIYVRLAGIYRTYTFVHFLSRGIQLDSASQVRGIPLIERKCQEHSEQSTIHLIPCQKMSAATTHNVYDSASSKLIIITTKPITFMNSFR